MTQEELESYQERFQDILKGQDEQIKLSRLINLRIDLRHSYSIPEVMYWERYSKANPEVAKFYREVVEAISNSKSGRFS